MRQWLTDHCVELVMITVVVAILVAVAFSSTGHCSHGQHEGVCGRKYKVYVAKVYKTRTCDCAVDHY